MRENYKTKYERLVIENALEKMKEAVFKLSKLNEKQLLFYVAFCMVSEQARYVGIDEVIETLDDIKKLK